jgi:hypothetical protein
MAARRVVGRPIDNTQHAFACTRFKMAALKNADGAVLFSGGHLYEIEQMDVE